MMLLEIKNLSKNYHKNKNVFNDLNLTLTSGVTALLGTNGAGKSSLMRILATISTPSSGQVIWNGKDISENPNILRKSLGYLPQSFGLYENLSAYEFLTYLASLKQLPVKYIKHRVFELLDLLNLSHVSMQPLHTFSGGMKQRIGIAQALLNDPQLLILDEPSVGLDPQERANLKALLSEISERKIIIYSTHIVSDISSIANNIALLNKGKLIEFSTPEAILNKLSFSVWQCTVSPMEAKELKSQYCITQSVKQIDGICLRIVSLEQPIFHSVNVPPTIEDAFLYYSNETQKPLSTLRKIA